MLKHTPIAIAAAALLLLPVACKGGGGAPAAEGAIVTVDGSSTVYPITEAVAEAYRAKSPKTRVTIGVSGTGGGFKKFCGGELSIADASRPIKPSEIEDCKAAGIEFIELPVAYDGIAVVVNPKATWVDHLTVAELARLWSPDAQGKIKRWSQIREGWPDEEIHLFGPGVDSGTYDYFTKAIVGTEHASRGDYTSSEDDNVVVQGISTDRLALGYFGFAYYEENSEKLKLVPVDDAKAEDGAGPIAPSRETVSNGTYQPLSRPIFIYVSSKALTNPDVVAFVDFYLAEAAKLSAEVGYIALPPDAYELVVQRWKSRKTGSVFASGGSTVGVTVQKLMANEK
ncbi:MAG: PstS family phosphate ABC transporter substrate-binding protein [Deltaproteobacteria bacterium]|nr:PstS family phosphate ABC transporter substrate-binding protein [Deltaproteobacteria bacterium]MCB9785227.1 PstS family phosphate ABC transporter substrate-binding protein [Deltaproteobacteria bacterium]